MGRRDAGDNPVTLTQTRCPGASMRGAAQAVVPLVVPGGAGCEAQSRLVGGRASDLSGMVRSIERVDGSRAHQVVGSQAQGGLQDAWCPIATIRLIEAVPGQPEGRVLGS
jgi:hypothetical protein